MPRKTRRNHLTSDELLSQINPDTMNLFNGFIDYMRSTAKSEGTIKDGEIIGDKEKKLEDL